MLKDGPKRILVVDDEASICLYISMVLSRDGYEVEIAYDAEEALRKIGNRKFDAVLTDLVMDPTDGADLAKMIKQRSPRQPVVMVTGFPLPSAAKTVDACILKPFSMKVLRETVQNVLEAAA